MSETLGLKNINMLTKEQFNGISNPATDELYAISGSGVGFPSNRYDDLELGASGATYTAPANGYFNVDGASSSSVGWVQLVNVSTRINSMAWNTSAENGLRCFVPVKKGDKVSIPYYNFKNVTLRFIYAEGE